MAKLSRRDIFRHLAYGGLMMSLPTFALARPAGNLSPPLASLLCQFFSNRESARVVGQRYLDLTPNEASTERLMALIFQSKENYARLAHADAEQLRAILSDQQRADFAHGRTIMIDGWILSETEVRLCALAAIL
jgi:hypothetical protein